MKAPHTKLTEQWTQSDTEAVTDQAGYAMGYWAETAEVDTTAHSYRVKPKQDQALVIDFSSIAPAVEVADTQGELSSAFIEAVASAAKEYPEDDCERIIQCAAFGQCRYG